MRNQMSRRAHTLLPLGKATRYPIIDTLLTAPISPALILYGPRALHHTSGAQAR